MPLFPFPQSPAVELSSLSSSACIPQISIAKFIEAICVTTTVPMAPYVGAYIVTAGLKKLAKSFLVPSSLYICGQYSQVIARYFIPPRGSAGRRCEAKNRTSALSASRQERDRRTDRAVPALSPLACTPAILIVTDRIDKTADSPR